MAAHVWVYNPETDAKWEAPADYVPVALARGWELTDPPPDPYAEPEEAPVEKPKAAPRRPRKSTAAKSANKSPKE